MNLSRRDFLCTASRTAAWVATSAALFDCAGPPDAGPQSADIVSARAGRKVLRPPAGRVLFLVGQEGPQLGGRPAEGLGNGYLDNMPTRP